MNTLFAISALCFFALLLAAIAITRLVRSSSRLNRRSTHPRHDFSQHLFAAANDQNSRTPSNLTHQTVKDVMAKKSWNQPTETVTLQPDSQSELASVQIAADSATGRLESTRKPPQSYRHKEWKRRESASFKKDRGRLIEPNQAPRLPANSTEKSISVKRA